METQREYHYTYYSYEEWGRGYIGSRSCDCLPEKDIKYFGSFADKNFNPTHKTILKGDYNSREEALIDEVILHQYYKVADNPHFANKAQQTSSSFFVSKEQRIENGKKYGSKAGKIGGKKNKENKTGICALTFEERSRNGKISGKKSYEKCIKEGIGFFSLTPEEKRIICSENAKRVNMQKWQCLETGFITNSGNLTKYQRARGIDTSKRIRLK